MKRNHITKFLTAAFLALLIAGWLRVGWERIIDAQQSVPPFNTTGFQLNGLWPTAGMCPVGTGNTPPAPMVTWALCNFSSVPVPISIINGGTGQSTASAALAALGGFPLAGGTVTGNTTFNKTVTIGSTVLIDSSSYASFSLACAAAVSANVPLFVSQTWTAIPTQTCAANLWFWDGSGVTLQPASAATLTLTGTITAPVAQIFDLSAGGTVTGLSIIEPEWLNAAGARIFNANVTNAIASSGATIVLQNATYTTTYSSGCFTHDDVWIKGAKMPVANSTYTALQSGTIIQGGFNSCGSNRLKVTDVGLDNGSALGTSTNDAFSASGLTGGGADPIIQGPYLQNVVGMESSGSVLFHAVRIEHCNNAFENNIYAYFGTHGVTIKCTNVLADSMHSFGENTDGLIVKSDSYTSTAHVKVSNIFNSTISSANVLNIGVVLDSNAAPLNDIQINGVTVTDARGGIAINGESTTGNGISVKNLVLQDINNSLGITFSGCVQFQGNTTQVNVSIENVQCLNTAGSGEGMQPINISTGCNSCQFSGFTVNGSNSASFLTGNPILINGYTSVNPTAGVVFQQVGASTVVFATNLYTTETDLNSGSSTAGSQLFTANVVGTSIPNGALGVPNITTSNGLFATSITTTVSALSTPTVLAGSGAASGILAIRDNTSGGSAMFLIDPNGGSQLIGTSQITGLAVAGDITFSGGNWNVALTSGSTPRVLGWVILGN